MLYLVAHIYVSNTSQHIEHSFTVTMPIKDGQQQKGIHSYELIRLTWCMRNNARLKQLELVDEGGDNTSKVLIPPSLSCHMFANCTRILNMHTMLIDVSICFVEHYEAHKKVTAKTPPTDMPNY
jgi:hypothetical protein